MNNKLLIFSLSIVLYISVLFIDAKSQNNVYFCTVEEYGLNIDENFSSDNNNISVENYSKQCETLVKKYIRENSNSSFFFDTKNNDIKNITNMNIGDEFYISTQHEVFKTNIIGFVLMNYEPMGYSLYPVLKNDKFIKYDSANYNNNFYLCSKSSNLGKTNKDESIDFPVSKNIKISLEKFTNKLKPGEGAEDPEYKFIKGNFIKSGGDEYAVSYRRRLEFDKYASGIFIMNSNGKILKTIIKFSSEFNFVHLIGIVDYNGDGISEIIVESGYYEGNGYEVYSIVNGEFIIIASGFYWGV